MSWRKTFFLMAFVVLAGLAAAPAIATDYYVAQNDPAADDANPGTEVLPWETLKKACNTLVAGDTVYVKAGTYIDPTNSFRVVNNGTAGNPITFISSPQLAAVVRSPSLPGSRGTYAWSLGPNSSYVIVDGFKIEGGIVAAYDRATYCTLRNLELIYGWCASDPTLNWGITLYWADYCVVENCYVHDLTSSGSTSRNTAGIMLFGDPDTSDGKDVCEYNIFQGNTVDAGFNVRNAYGIKAGYLNNNTWRYNVALNASVGYHTMGSTSGEYNSSNNHYYQNIAIGCGAGFDAGYAVDHSYIYNNTAVDCDSFYTSYYDSVTDIELWNNILQGNNDIVIEWPGYPGIYPFTHLIAFSNYNCFYDFSEFAYREKLPSLHYYTLGDWQSATGYDMDTITSNPLLVGGGDYHLQGGSPCINAGVDLQDYDDDQNTTESINMGAYITGSEIIGHNWGPTPPGQASNPSPADSATDVSVDADLSWSAGSGSTSSDVYFGTSSPGTFQGNQTATTYDPGTMANDTTYYWRIDEINAEGTTTGSVWSFTTETAPAGIYYVDQGNPAADDANPGTEALPWETLRKATQTVVAGDTVYVKAGTYIDTIEPNFEDKFEVVNNGTAANPITFISTPQHAAIVRSASLPSSRNAYAWGLGEGAQYIIIDGFKIEGGIVLGYDGCDHCTIRNCELIYGRCGDSDPSLNWGIATHDADYCTIENNYVHDMTDSGNHAHNTACIMVFGNSDYNILQGNTADASNGIIYNAFGQKGGQMDHNIWRYNLALNATAGFLGMASTDETRPTEDNTYYQNIAVNCDNAFFLDHMAYRFVIYNNTAVDCDKFFTASKNTNVDTELWNNILVGTNFRAIWWSGYPDAMPFSTLIDYSNYNCFYNNAMIAFREKSPSLYYYTLNDWQTGTGFDMDSIVDNPLLVGGGDYHLQGSSPCINAGVDLQDYDDDQNTTESINMGAYITGSEVIGHNWGPTAPSQATSPNPGDSATDVSITADLSWTAGSGSTSSDVYFGTDSTPDAGEFQGNQTATTFEPGTMANSTTYYWRIDEINAEGTTAGNVWSFTTETAPPLPGQASNPSPADSATDVSITADLSWTAGSGATSHDVYFGTSSPGTFQGNQTATTYDPGTMTESTTYYWRIDEVNAQGTTAGNVWSFTTGTAPPAFLQDGGADGIVSMEAENYDGNTSQGGFDWTFVTSPSGYTNTGAMEATPNSGTNNDTGYAANSPRLDFQVDFVKTGTHYIWVRGYGASGSDDSCHAGLDGQEISTCDRINSFTTSYTWHKDTMDAVDATFDVASTGVHTVNVWMREDGFIFDKIVLTTNAGYTPTGDGPAESPRGAQPPGQASSPDPADSATDVSIDADLSWTAGADATSRDVYFGTSSPGAFQGNQTDTTFDPGTLSYDVTYYWRIDEVNAQGTTTGNVWSFTTEAAPTPPGQATNPDPADSATDVSIIADLSWTAGTNSTSSDVYFGTSSPGTLQGNQTATTFDPGTMDYDTTYYWRIDEINTGGTTTGNVWSFTTAAVPISECDNWQTLHPEWIFCDDFETEQDLSVNYNDRSENGMSVTTNDPFDGTYSLEQEYTIGQVDAGWITKFIGDNPHLASPGDKLDEVYYRFYHKFEDGFTGLPPKMAKVKIFRTSDDWSGGLAVYQWIASSGPLTADIKTYDGSDYVWLPITNSTLDYSNPANIGSWICIEVRVKSNTVGESDGEVQYWADGQEILYATGLNLQVENNNGKGLNMVMWDCYWNDGSPVEQSRFYDNLVISTAPIGEWTPGQNPPGPATNPSPADSATDVSVDADLSWTAGTGSTSSDVYFGTTSPGTFQGNQAATTFDTGSMANDTTYYWRIDEINAEGTTTGTVWSFTTIVAVPSQASSPTPADSAADIAVDTDLSWTAGSGATSHDVYFGTSSPGTFQGNLTATTFDPGTMANDTTYYWRIDEVNAGGTTTGTVWNFTTIVTLPAQASSPSPGTGASDIAIDTDLSWTAGSGTTSHDVYFGTSSPGSFQGNQASTTFDTGSMSNDTTYYWRIDEVNAGGTTTGTVWSFTTIVSAPGQASNPSPGNGATDVAVNTDLSWAAGSGATSHDVYFGTSSPGAFQGNQAATTFDPGAMANDTTYYWRIDEVNTGGTTTGTVWNFTTIVAAPGQASSPSPGNGATDIAVNTDLSWTAGSGAASHDVYFGTSSPGSYQGNQAATTFDTSTMGNDTTYYWRIDEVNAGGTTTGTVWSFTTIVAAPGQASSPSPANAATDVDINANLSWTAGSGAASHDVYFGTSSPGTFQGNQTATTFEPGTMGYDTTYYWRIDEINAGGTTTGTVWSFTTIVAVPSQASSPTPGNGTTDVDINANLSWTAGSGATSHDVYFGTSSPGAFQSNQTATTFDPGTMANDTTYYWRIDEINAGGTTAGTVWSFTTESAPLPPPGQANNPSPADSATDVSINADLSWTAGSNATSHDVYFGTSSPGAFQGNQTATTFDPGTMAEDTTHYWRIDEINASGTTTGTVWSFTTGQQPAIDPNLVGWWEFDNNANDSVGTNDGTIYGAVATSGKIGQAFSFDEIDDYITIPDLDYTNASDEFSLSFWFKIDDVAGDFYHYMFSHGIVSTNNSLNVYFSETNEGTGGEELRTRIDLGDGTMWYAVSEPVFADGAWHLYTITVSSVDGATIYVDANSILTNPDVKGASMAPTTDIYVGARNDLNVDRFYGNPSIDDGLIDDLRLYNRVLSSTEVVTLAAGGAPQPPGQASNPSPADSATDVSVDADLSWTAGSGATSHDVYFGTSSPGAFQGNQTATTFDTGSMSNDTTYYWRIDEINAEGTTTGTVWSFTTIVAAPGQASNPSPADSATDVSIDADLSWTAGSGATSSDVYFGTTSPGTFQGNQTATTFEPGTIGYDTTYYWRIDEINVGGTTAGSVWSFTTGAAPPPLPGQASNPSPADSSTDVTISADLSWTAGSDATSHDVYFGTTSPGTFQGNQTAATFDPGTMANDTTYYWRIDEVNATGTTTGVVWSFTTMVAAGSEPIGWWQLDEGSGAAVDDSSSYGNDGTIDGPVWLNDAERGWCLDFDGDANDKVVIPNEPFFDLTGNMTVMGWIKASYIDWRNLSAVISKGTDGGGWALQKAQRENGIGFYANVSGMPWYGVKSNVAVFDNTWHHVAGVYDGSKAYIYVDGGADVNSIDCSGSIGTNDYPVWVGNNSEGVRAWAGLLSDVRVYDSALSQSEINDIYSGGPTLPGQATNPSPADSATDVDIDADLSWTPGTGSTSSDVYFGTTSPGSFQGNQTATTFDPGTLANDTTYYWRIDEVNAAGTTTGVVWSFTTVAAPEWTELTYDDFESGWGNYTDGGGDCSLYTGGTYAHQGSNAADIQDNSGVSSSFYHTNGIDVDTPGYTQIKVEFWYIPISMDNSKEDFWLQYYDGTDWNTVETWVRGVDFDNGEPYNPTVYIDESSYTFPTDMKIRFMCDASGNQDDVYIDEIRVSAK